MLDQPLLVPDGPAVPNGYVTSRQTEKHWSDEDVEQWFTEPDRQEVEKLGDANDRIINEITLPKTIKIIGDVCDRVFVMESGRIINEIIGAAP